MSIESQIEREEDEIYAALERGDISNKECNDQLRELQRDYAAAAQEAAEMAYEAEMDRW